MKNMQYYRFIKLYRTSKLYYNLLINANLISEEEKSVISFYDS